MWKINTIYFIRNLLTSSFISFNRFHRKNERGQTLQVNFIQLSETTLSVIDSTQVDSVLFFWRGRIIIHLQYLRFSVLHKIDRDLETVYSHGVGIQVNAKRICICTSGEAKKNSVSCIFNTTKRYSLRKKIRPSPRYMQQRPLRDLRGRETEWMNYNIGELIRDSKRSNRELRTVEFSNWSSLTAFSMLSVSHKLYFSFETWPLR